MLKELKILSINFPFRTPWIVQTETLATPRALFDFDVVIIRPYLLASQPSGGPWQIEYRAYHEALEEVRGKNEDISRLLRQGGLLVVILDEFQELKFDSGAHTYTGGTVYTVTNYDFLDEHFSECMRNGRGNNLKFLDPTEPFVPVVKNSKVEWTAFIGSRPPYPFNNTVFFLKNGADSFVGGHAPELLGDIVFLPNCKELNEEKFFDACRDYRSRREGTPEPTWAEQVFLPGVSEAEGEMASIDEQLGSIKHLRKQAQDELDALLAYKKLLYEKGKTQLEPIARKTLDKLGFGTTPSETISGTGFEIDGRTTVGLVPGILEIKGSRRQIALDEFSPFIPKILADLGATGHPSKGILIGNGLCENPPADRLGEKVFSSHVLQAAKTQSIALVNSVDLYCILCSILSGKNRDLVAIRENILGTNGFVDLLQFCDES